MKEINEWREYLSTPLFVPIMKDVHCIRDLEFVDSMKCIYTFILEMRE
jgi:hypothetical protein